MNASGSAGKISTAVRAAPGKLCIDASGAKCAFEGTDPGIVRIRRQVAVTTLTAGSHLQHDNVLEIVGAAVNSVISVINDKHS